MRLLTLLVVLTLLFSSYEAPAAVLASTSASQNPALSELPDLYQAVAPAVVGITCVTKVAGQQQGYFGTGAVISKTGLILSNISVVPGGALDIKVYFTSGEIVSATIVNSDRASEGVLLQLDEPPADMVVMTLADDTASAIGDPVLTWGNPHMTIMNDGAVSLSRGHITTRGNIISRYHQSSYRGEVFEVDAAVNGGSDGGPLTDRAGRLIGLQSLALADRSWLGLAIPLSVMRKGLPELAKLPLQQPTTVADLAANPQVPLHESYKIQQELLTQGATFNDSIVSIWVQRQGDKIKPPKRHQDIPLEGAPAIPTQQRSLYERQVPAGFGTGMIISSDGLIVTASINLADRHSVGTRKLSAKDNQLKNLWVYTADGNRHKATFVTANSRADLGLIQINGSRKDWPHIDLDSLAPVTVTPGMPVALLGRSMPPGDLSVYSGSVSGANRNWGTHNQISAMTNYGNVGGPVIDRNGTMLGMANWLAGSTNWRQNCGVGFVTTSDQLKKALQAMQAGKPIPQPERPYTGMNAENSTEAEGPVINIISPDGPAAQAGLQVGDVLLEWNGHVVDSAITLVGVFGMNQIGDDVAVTVRRGQQRLQFTLRIGKH